MSGLGSADEASSAAVWEGVKDPPDSKVGDDSPAVVKPRRRGKKSGKIAKDIRKFLVCSGPVNTGCPGPSTPKDLWGLCFTRNGRTRLLRPLSLYLLAARQMISSQLVWRSPFQAPLVFAGLCSALICEGASSHSPRYNTIVMLALVAAVEYPNLPPKSVRPQITLAIITALSCALDVFYLLVNPALAALYKGLLAVTVAGKGAALYTYLTRARNTLRARKYLVRRVRLFGIPIAEPRRLGRDIRGRFLALAIIQLLCCLSNLAFFIVLVTSMGYSDIFLTSRASGISLPTFVLLKSITSFALFVSLALDSDPVLALAYFGCLGWMMGFVKDYTRKKRLELGGWPYPFFYNETRYTFFIWGKMLDCLWGVVGWVIIGGTFGSESATMESGLKALLTLVGLTLVLSDIWTPLLMLGINWLLRRRRSLRENEVLSDSDDSELDELAIRDPKAVLPHPKSKHRHKGRRRQKLAEEARRESNLDSALAILVAKRNRREAELVRIPSGQVGAFSSSSSSSGSGSSSSSSSSDSDSEASEGSLFEFEVVATNNPLSEQYTSSRPHLQLPSSQDTETDGWYYCVMSRSKEKPGANDVRIVAWRSGSEFLCDNSGLTFTPTALPPSNLEMALDVGCTVHPRVYERLWLLLAVDVAFTAKIAPLAAVGDAVSNEALCSHLTQVGFYVVANGLGDVAQGQGAKVFALAAGRPPFSSPRVVDDERRCLCLVECTLTEGEGGQWTLACVLRCTESRHAQLFVSKLSLGDLFDLKNE